MPVRSSEATWEGDLRTGSGNMTVGDSLFQGTYSFASRFQEGEGTNPEELLAAAQAGCYAMALSNGLASQDFTPVRVHVLASVTLKEGTITQIDLDVDAEVEGISKEEMLEFAEAAKSKCPVSQALEAVPEMELSVTLR